MDANPEVDICMCNGFVDDMTGDEKIMFPNSCSYTIADAKSEFLNLLNTNRLVYLWAKMYRHLALKDFKLNEDVYIGEDRIGCWQLFTRIIMGRYFHCIIVTIWRFNIQLGQKKTGHQRFWNNTAGTWRID